MFDRAKIIDDNFKKFIVDERLPLSESRLNLNSLNFKSENVV